MVKLPLGYSPIAHLKHSTGQDSNVFTDISVRGGKRSPADGSFIGADPTNVVAATATATNKGNTSNKSGNTRQNQDAVYSGYATGSAQPAVDAASISALERQLARTQDSIGRISGQQSTALANLLGQRDNQRSRLDNQRADTQADHNRAVGQTTSNFGRTKERIGENVRQNTTSLQRMMGARGAGSSSAATILAPWAAARAGTSEREEAGQEFSSDMSNLDTNWRRFDREWGQSVRDLDTDYKNKVRASKSGFANRESELQDNLAELRTRLSQARGGGNVDTAAIDRRINQLLGNIDKWAKQQQSQVIRANDPRYQAAELSDYDIDTRNVEQAQEDPTYDETQYYYPVREDEEDQFLQNLYA